MRFAWTKKKIERLTWRTLEGDDAAAIAAERGGCPSPAHRT